MMNNLERYESSNKPNKDLHILDILNDMRRAGFENSFIYSLTENCQKYEGIHDLMEMWAETLDPSDREKIVADLQESIDDIIDAPKKPEERAFIRFDDLDEIKQDVLEFKKQLRKEIDRQGGISELSRKTGIPQPSLSRFFASSAMPRRTTLFKIAKAFNLPESSISFKWLR